MTTLKMEIAKHLQGFLYNCQSNDNKTILKWSHGTICVCMMHVTVMIKKELMYLVQKGRTREEFERNGESGADAVLMYEVYIKMKNIK